MNWNQDVVRLVAAERQAHLAEEMCVAATTATHNGDASWWTRLLATVSRRHRDAVPSPWLWTRPLDVANCDTRRAMPW